ncbi:hypothetical protein SCHPADRAFT_622389 [Schizopora paradoxa]|uniref:Transmembrane protein n=1 Tax=Schizopora paradoxa TaxID=27342 RepID=A0A0H2REW7_9AGAM|nr:hypothetical protein SCHPADRAFT_622389 [Schizopora paradoxa]
MGSDRPISGNLGRVGACRYRARSARIGTYVKEALQFFLFVHFVHFLLLFVLLFLLFTWKFLFTQLVDGIGVVSPTSVVPTIFASPLHRSQNPLVRRASSRTAWNLVLITVAQYKTLPTLLVLEIGLLDDGCDWLSLRCACDKASTLNCCSMIYRRQRDEALYHSRNFRQRLREEKMKLFNRSQSPRILYHRV